MRRTGAYRTEIRSRLRRPETTRRLSSSAVSFSAASPSVVVAFFCADTITALVDVVALKAHAALVEADLELQSRKLLRHRENDRRGRRPCALKGEREIACLRFAELLGQLGEPYGLVDAPLRAPMLAAPLVAAVVEPVLDLASRLPALLLFDASVFGVRVRELLRVRDEAVGIENLVGVFQTTLELFEIGSRATDDHVVIYVIRHLLSLPLLVRAYRITSPSPTAPIIRAALADLHRLAAPATRQIPSGRLEHEVVHRGVASDGVADRAFLERFGRRVVQRSEEHTSE